MSYQSEVLADAPVAYWRLGEPSGTNANDEIGTNDGTCDTGVAFAGAGALTGDANTAATFDGGADSDIAFGSTALAGAPFSLEVWAFCTGAGSVGDTSWGALMGYQATRRILFDTSGINGDNILVQMGGANMSAPNSSITRNAWYHIVYTYSGGFERLYINGLEKVSQATGSGPTWNAPFWLGAAADPIGNYAFKGRLDEPAVYATALSPARVLAHYQTGLALSLNKRVPSIPSIPRRRI